MSRICDLCGRGAKKAISRSHSHRATIRKQYLNLQKITYRGKRIKACASCIRNLSQVK